MDTPFSLKRCDVNESHQFVLSYNRKLHDGYQDGIC